MTRLEEAKEQEVKPLHARCDAWEHRTNEIGQDLDRLDRENQKQARHVRILLAVPTEITDAHRVVAGSVPVVIEAEKAIHAVLREK